MGHDKAVADWAGGKFGTNMPPGCIAWGVVNPEGRLTGALVFFGYQRGGNIEFAMVGSSVMRLGIFRHMARYVFGHLGCSRLTARTARGNVMVRKMLPRAGFKFEGVNKRWFGPLREDDALVYAMFPEHARRWMN